MTNKPEKGYWNIYNVDHSGFAGRFVGNFHKTLEAVQEAAKEECRMEPKTKHITRMYGSKRSYLADKKLNTVGLQGEYGYYNGYAFTDADGKKKVVRGFFFTNQEDCERACKAVTQYTSFVSAASFDAQSRKLYAERVAQELTELCYPERMQKEIRRLESKGFDMTETPEENKQTVRGLEDERKHLMKKTKTEFVGEHIMNAEEKYRQELAAAKSKVEELKQVVNDLQSSYDCVQNDLRQARREVEHLMVRYTDVKQAFDAMSKALGLVNEVILEKRHPAQIVPEATSFMPDGKIKEL